MKNDEEFNKEYYETKERIEQKICEQLDSSAEAALMSFALMGLRKREALVNALMRRTSPLAREISSLTPDERTCFSVLLEEYDTLRHKK